MLFGLLLGGVELVDCTKMDGGGETSPSVVAGEDTTMGNRASTIGREILDLSMDFCGVLCNPIRFVSSATEKPRLGRGRCGAFALPFAGENLGLRRSSSIPTRSPIEVLLRFRRIEGIALQKVLSQVFKVP